MQNVSQKSPYAMPEFEIQLRDVMLFGRHGVLPQERQLGNQYRINVRLRIDASSFDAEADTLSSTISYADVFDMLKEEMDRSASLLESVAVRLSISLRQRWPHIRKGSIEIVKTVPPIPEMIGEAGVKYEF